MSNWLRRACVCVFAATTVTACTLKNVNVPPEELMRQFQAGQPMLDCRLDCGGAWGANRQRVATLDATGQWKDLALLVMQIGYEDDLSYYYLGHAAENLGYLQAAERYYRVAERLSVSQMSCAQGEANIATTLGLPANLCDGYVFPDALYPHLEVVEARLAALSAPTSTATTQRTPTKRLVKKQPQQTPTASSTAGSAPSSPGASQTPASGFVVPPPTATSASAAGGFVEPAPSSSDPFAPPPVRH
jgi:hypothetical protein